MQACLNGARAAVEHPALAVTPEQLAAEAAAAVAAGADDLHVHPKTSDGRDSLVAAHVAAWIDAVRAVADVPVGVTTGAWSWAGGVRPAQAIAGWTTLPDHASVNWHEAGRDALATALCDRGIALHVGLWSVDVAQEWLDSPWRERTERVLLELPDVDGQESVARELVDLVAPTGIPMLLHGEDRSAWPILDCAIAWGLPTRVGLEDVLEGPDGESVTGNADLLRLAARR